jgi:hypothetical protein
MSAPMEIPPGYSIRGSGGAFGDCEQALGRARFGAMFFPDKSTAFAEARRVLRPGGTFLFNVWDRIEDNEFADCVTQTMAGLFPTDPPRFLARLPHGYSDQGAIATALSQGRCGHRPALWYRPCHWEDSGHRHRSHPRCVERMRPLKKYQDLSAPQQARPITETASDAGRGQCQQRRHHARTAGRAQSPVHLPVPETASRRNRSRDPAQPAARDLGKIPVVYSPPWAEMTLRLPQHPLTTTRPMPIHRHRYHIPRIQLLKPGK